MSEKYVVFIRGINVGGKNIVKMKPLSESLLKSGFEVVKTYIQSGNIVISTDNSSVDHVMETVSNVLNKEFNVEAPIMALSISRFEEAINNNPYDDQELDPKTVHMAFLSDIPSDNCHDKLNSIKKESESYEIIDHVLYLHAPDGIGRSKFVANMEKILGVDVTVRNLRTVKEVWKLLAN